MILEKNRKKMTLAPMLGKQDLTVTHNHRRFQILPRTCQFLEGHNSVMQPLFKSLKFTRQKKGNLEKTFGCFQKQFFFPPQIIIINRAFHYFHHPFWGTLVVGKKTSEFRNNIVDMVREVAESAAPIESDVEVVRGPRFLDFFQQTQDLHKQT